MSANKKLVVLEKDVLREIDATKKDCREIFLFKKMVSCLDNLTPSEEIIIAVDKQPYSLYKARFLENNPKKHEYIIALEPRAQVSFEVIKNKVAVRLRYSSTGLLLYESPQTTSRLYFGEVRGKFVPKPVKRKKMNWHVCYDERGLINTFAKISPKNIGGKKRNIVVVKSLVPPSEYLEDDDEETEKNQTLI